MYTLMHTHTHKDIQNSKVSMYKQVIQCKSITQVHTQEISYTHAYTHTNIYIYIYIYKGA